MYGLKGMSRYRQEEGDVDVIGEIDTSHAGNVTLRIGRTLGKERGSGWRQIGYVVLTPDEARELAAELKGQAAGNEWVVVDTETDPLVILGTFVRREEDAVRYLPEGAVPGEEKWAPDDCVEVMSRWRYEQEAAT